MKDWCVTIRFVNTFSRNWAKLERNLMPACVWQADPLTFWRERILFIPCFSSVLLGALSLIFALQLAYRQHLWSIIFLDSIAYFTAVLLLSRRNWSLKVGGLLIYRIFYLLGAPDWAQNIANPLQTMLALTINFLFVKIFLTIATAFMIDGLKKALEKEKEISANLRQSEERYRIVADHNYGWEYRVDSQG
jgi:two-component system cell cycle sensor histidine kinase/response regulator CckA